MVVKLSFELKYYIPIVDDITFVHSYADFATFKYRFVRIAHISNDPVIAEFSTTTIIIEFIPEIDVSSWDMEKHAKEAFIACLLFINQYLDAYRLANNIEFISNFTIPDLPPYIIMIIGDDTIGYTLPHLTKVAGISTPSKDMTKLATEKIMVWDAYRRFGVIDKFRSKAIYHLYTEEFMFAIIELQTSFEAYIRMCQHLILQKQNLPEAEIEKYLLFPLKNTIEQHLAKALKENLDFKTNMHISKWNLCLYKLRNEIIHTGRMVFFGNEGYEAYDSYQEVINYLSDLMVREKLISADKNIDVTDLNKNIFENHDPILAKEELKKRGILTFLEGNDLESKPASGS